MATRLILGLGAGLLASLASAQILEYTESRNDASSIALGFAPPQPVDSASALSGFRRYDALLSGLDFLAASSPALDRINLGQSGDGRDIVGYRLSDGDALSADQLPIAAAVLHSGGIHAREWASPEVVAFLIEEMTARSAATPGLERYLAEQMQLLWIPVLNPDGFVTTQNHPVSVRGTRDLPRDGRMRRKNWRDTDGDLATAGDTLLGVDLNRNFGPLWNSANQSSTDPSSIVYKGPAQESEPESQALLAAAASLPANSLRLFIDTHSFGRVLFYYSPTPRLGAITRSLADTIGRTTQPRYVGLETPGNQSFGSTDEHFAFAPHQVPAYTLEIEPGSSEAVEYGGNAVSHSGFILPDDEIERVRREIYELARLAYYHQAGPAILEQASLERVGDDQANFLRRWQPQNAQRILVASGSGISLQAGETYRLTLRFNKPMRLRAPDSDQIVNYPGQTITLSPSVSLRAGSVVQELPADDQGWLNDDSLRYNDDSWAVEFVLANGLDQASALDLTVSVRDLAGLALDANPATPARWGDGSWQDYDTDDCQTGDAGGSDRNLRFGPGTNPAGCQAPAPSPNPTPSAPPATGGSSGAGGLLLILFAAWRRCRRQQR